MSKQHRNSSMSSFKLMSVVLGLFMGCLFMIFGLGILFGWFVQETLDDTMMKVFGVAMLAYGAFRLVRVYLRIKEEK